MPHQVFGRHLGRSVGQRNALRRTLITQLFQHERITTTEAKAKAIRGEAEHMITQAKRGLATGDVARVVYLRRLLNGRLNDPEMVKKLFDVFAPRYQERPGGYTRIYKLGPRKGDAAEMVILELVDRDKSTSGEDAASASATTPASRAASGARSLINRVRRPRAATSTTESESKS
jgi:large subunit ribosomal protein L17